MRAFHSLKFVAEEARLINRSALMAPLSDLVPWTNNGGGGGARTLFAPTTNEAYNKALDHWRARVVPFSRASLAICIFAPLHLSIRFERPCDSLVLAFIKQKEQKDNRKLSSSAGADIDSRKL